MSLDKHDMDEWLRGKLNEKQFEWKEQYWEQAQQMLDEARPRKRRYFFWVILACSVTLGAVVLTYNEKGGNEWAAEQKKVDLITKAPVTTTTVNPQTILSVKSPIASPNPKPVVNAITLKKEKRTADKTTAANKNEMNPIPVALKSTSSKQLNSYTLNDEQKRIVEDEEKTHDMVNAEESNVLVDKWIPNEDGLLQEEGNVERKLMTTYWINMLPLTKASVPLLTEVRPSPVLNKPSPWLVESGIKVHAGTTAFNVNTPSLEILGGNIGLGYQYVLNPRLSLSANVDYTQTHQQGNKRYYVAGGYGFGEPTQRIGLNTVRLDYVGGGLNAHYHFKERHGIFAGASVMVIVHSKELLQNKNDQEFNRETNGYYRVFNRIDYWLNLGYNYQLSPTIGTSVTLHQGLRPLSANNEVSGLLDRKNLGLTWSINYKIY